MTITTIEAGKLMFAGKDDRTDLPGLVTITSIRNEEIVLGLNPSETINLTEGELEEFQKETGHEIDSDMVPKELLWKLEFWLEEEGLLETTEAPSNLSDSDRLLKIETYIGESQRIPSHDCEQILSIINS
jgi:hypothetical protein